MERQRVKTVPLRIAFDMDGVLADMDWALAERARILFGPGVEETIAETPDAPETEAPAEDAPQAPGEGSLPATRLRLTGRQQRRLWRDVRRIDGFWESLREIEPGSVARLATLAETHQWEVIFLTRRPATAGFTVQRQTQRWLAERGFTMPSVYVVQGLRGRIAAALDLDVVVDDRPENCLDVVLESNALATLIWRDSQVAVPTGTKRLGIAVMPTVAACLDMVERLSTDDGDPPGLVDRVKRLLGLKPDISRT